MQGFRWNSPVVQWFSHEINEVQRFQGNNGVNSSKSKEKHRQLLKNLRKYKTVKGLANILYCTLVHFGIPLTLFHMAFFMDVKHMGEGVKITPSLKFAKTSAIDMTLGRNVVQHVNIWKKTKKVSPFCWRQHFFAQI